MDQSGVVDSSSQWVALILMALSEKKISKIKLGRITPFTIETLRIIKELLGITFKIEQDEANIIQNQEDNEIEVENKEEDGKIDEP